MIDSSKTSTSDPNEKVVITRAEYERLLTSEARMSMLEHELDKLKRMIFGAKSERFVPADDAQLSLDLGQQPTVIAVKTE